MLIEGFAENIASNIKQISGGIEANLLKFATY